MTLSAIFSAAHRSARAAVAAGATYRAAFSTALKSAWAASRAPARVVREFQAHGGRAWVAAITGRDAKFDLARQFLGKRDVTVCRTNTYRSIETVIELREGAVYEWSCQESARRNERGFWIVRGGKLAAADRRTVEAALA